jgi:hypothetical protein
MKTLWQFIARILFWDYERGSAPYDLMVAGVVAFVLLTPRAWFNDHPASASGTVHGDQLRLIAEDAAARTRTFRIDGRLLAPTNPDPQWERKAHDLLEKNVADLRRKKFSIVRVEAHPALDGTVLYYDVLVK